MAESLTVTTRTPWQLDPSAGELLVRTDVAGRAARMGHRLTIAMTRWSGTAWLVDDAPVAADLAIDVSSFRVVQGDGGVTPLSGAEKAIVRSNALKVLGAGAFPEIRFSTDRVEEAADGSFRATGTLLVRGTAREHVLHVQRHDLGAAWRFAVGTEVRQSEFGVERYSLLGGMLRVVDTVAVSVVVERAKA